MYFFLSRNVKRSKPCPSSPRENEPRKSSHEPSKRVKARPLREEASPETSSHEEESTDLDEEPPNIPTSDQEASNNEDDDNKEARAQRIVINTEHDVAILEGALALRVWRASHGNTTSIWSSVLDWVNKRVTSKVGYLQTQRLSLSQMYCLS